MCRIRSGGVRGRLGSEENGSSQGQNLALTVLYVPSSLDLGSEVVILEGSEAEQRFYQRVVCEVPR